MSRSLKFLNMTKSRETEYEHGLLSADGNPIFVQTAEIGDQSIAMTTANDFNRILEINNLMMETSF
jgi:hypothetical protein